MPARPEIYISVDVEADGPHPGDYSMLALGMTACATFDGKTFKRLDMDDSENSFITNLKPVTHRYTDGAAEICRQGGFDRFLLVKEGRDPYAAMQAANNWVEKLRSSFNAKPVAVAYPLSFDWMWIYYYYIKYSTDSPFGFSNCIDIKSFYQGKAGAMVMNSTKRNMPKKLRSTRPHTHDPLDDAREQGDLFCNIWEWTP
jgi:hypothetical protein